jgi:hypothetical protein
MRAKSAPLGADAVVLTDSGIVVIHNSSKLWATGFALRYNDSQNAEPGKTEGPPDSDSPGSERK